MSLLSRCVVCKKEIGIQENCFYDHARKISMCMGCEGVEIDVWRVTLPHDTKNGYYERDIQHVVDMLNECDFGDGYIVTKEKIIAWKYHTLPEFTGF